MISEPIQLGRAHRIVFITTGLGNAKSFAEVGEKERGTPAWKKLRARMQRICDHGLDKVCRNDSTCKRFRGKDRGLGEFKIHRPPYRVMFFECEHNHGLIVITHCFKKTQKETPKNEMNRAHRLKEAYNNWRDSRNDTKP